MKTQKLLTYLRKCIQEYDLIQEGQKIAVGLSGGKDSTVLLYGLARLREFYPKHFDLTAITVDPGFGMDYTPIASYCESLGIPYVKTETNIAQIVFHQDFHESPCSLCANMRRAALVEAALQEQADVIALGHHKDDYLTTLLLSLFYEGRFYTFSPKTTYEDREIQVIRPMLYVPEAAISHFAAENRLPILKNACPNDHLSKRTEMNRLLQELQGRYPNIKDRLLHAVETGTIPDWADLRSGEKTNAGRNPDPNDERRNHG